MFSGSRSLYVYRECDVLILNLPMVGLWVQLLRVPYAILAPVIVLFCCIGSLQHSQYGLRHLGDGSLWGDRLPIPKGQT